jgi:putative flippase GtrA
MKLHERPFVRFVMTGGLAAAVNILARIALSNVMSFEMAVLIAYLIGMTTAFVLARTVVFAPGKATAAVQYLRFGLVNLVALAQVWIVSVGLAEIVFPWLRFDWHAETIAHVIGVTSPVVTSYFGHKHFSFR